MRIEGHAQISGCNCQGKHIFVRVTGEGLSIQNDTIKHRLPLHKYMVNLLVAQCTTHFLCLNQIYLSKLYSAIFATAYYGLLRISEIATGTHPILALDVHVGVNSKKVLLVLRTSKTHWKNKKPQLIRINSNGSLTKQ